MGHCRMYVSPFLRTRSTAEGVLMAAGKWIRPRVSPPAPAPPTGFNQLCRDVAATTPLWFWATVCFPSCAPPPLNEPPYVGPGPPTDSFRGVRVTLRGLNVLYSASSGSSSTIVRLLPELHAQVAVQGPNQCSDGNGRREACPRSVRESVYLVEQVKLLCLRYLLPLPKASISIYRWLRSLCH